MELSSEHKRKLIQSNVGNKHFFGHKHTEDWKIKASKERKGKTKPKKWTEGRKGSGNPAWKGGSKILITCALEGCGKQKLKRKDKIREHNFCSIKCCTLYNLSHNKKSGTDIEILIEKELIKRGISFIKQFSIPNAGTVPDFLLSDNIIIYCDGDYWHCNPSKYSPDYFSTVKKMYARDIWKQDREQTYCLELLGYKVFRFWGNEIVASPSNCLNKVLLPKIYL